MRSTQFLLHIFNFRPTSMYTPLTNPLALDNAQQWFNDLITLADPDYLRSRLRHHIDAYRVQALNLHNSKSLFNQLIGFLDTLVACEVITPQLGREFNLRLIIGFESAWMTS
ncbi:hypothetical protein DL347_05750 [Pseudomonas fluorescens]|uniref:Uncharacterized protein n=2 Tax=Pseudomonas fluorescens TaxID=294 RepID=A0A7Z6MZA0_PSEFL|nr:hypothetical protein DL347_05750 [Pseudomonas fluorescens]